MSKRLIGIEIGGDTLRIAILNRGKGQMSVDSLLERSYADTDELAGHLNELLAGDFGFGDQLATSLLARSAYVRNLSFPFQDEKKIAAAIPFELFGQLPVSNDDCATATQKIQHTGAEARVAAAAVPRQTLEALLALFEQAGVPLHRVDLAPFCYAAGLGEQIGDGFLVCATDRETTVCLLQNGVLTDYRLLPTAPEQPAASRGQALLRDINVMAHAAGRAGLPISLMGPAITPELERAMQAAEFKVDRLALNLGGQVIDAAFLPAVALALRAKTDRADHSFNFRRGAYALKGEWANLKRKLTLLTVLFCMSIVILGVSMTVKYIDKAQRAEQLQAEMVSVYRTLFPEAATIVDVPLQLQSAIGELRQKNNLISGIQVSPLAILKEVSRLPELVTIELQEFSMGPEELKLSGRTASFEDVNQMARILEQSPLFANVQVADAKMSLDGNRIDFRLSLPYATRGSAQ